ncbi:MAG: hypothetical protein ACLPND_14685 [Candidatus Korobacteraceae bacterium]|jgi:uncharacterized membrane protein
MTKIFRFVTICTTLVAFAALSIAWAQTYTAVNYPGAAATAIVGGPNLEGTSVGIYNLTAGGANHGFSLTAKGAFTAFDVPGSASTTPNFINLQGVIVGAYTDSAGTSHGFVLDRGKYTTVDYPGAPGSTLAGINDLGEMSGTYCSDAACDSSATLHSFVLSRKGVFTSFDPPGASSSGTSTVSLLGAVVGNYATSGGSGQGLGYLLFGGKYTTINFPSSSFTFAGGGNIWNQIAGIYTDSAGNSHGFLLSNGSYTSFDYPGATLTEATGINAVGVIVGLYISPTDPANVFHGFVRTP